MNRPFFSLGGRPGEGSSYEPGWKSSSGLSRQTQEGGAWRGWTDNLWWLCLCLTLKFKPVAPSLTCCTTSLDLMGSPLVNQEGMALFGHGRDSQPVVNPKGKVLMVGGKQVLGLNPPRVRTTTTTTTTTAAPTTTPAATTPEWASEEYTTAPPYPSCPPGTFSKTDAYGYPVLDPEGILDCYPEGKFDVKFTRHRRQYHKNRSKQRFVPQEWN